MSVFVKDGRPLRLYIEQCEMKEAFRDLFQSSGTQPLSWPEPGAYFLVDKDQLPQVIDLFLFQDSLYTADIMFDLIRGRKDFAKFKRVLTDAEKTTLKTRLDHAMKKLVLESNGNPNTSAFWSKSINEKFTALSAPAELRNYWKTIDPNEQSPNETPIIIDLEEFQPVSNGKAPLDLKPAALDPRPDVHDGDRGLQDTQSLPSIAKKSPNVAPLAHHLARGFVILTSSRAGRTIFSYTQLQLALHKHRHKLFRIQNKLNWGSAALEDFLLRKMAQAPGKHALKRVLNEIDNS